MGKHWTHEMSLFPQFAVEPDAHIWRYMDLPKFVSMVTSSKLYFARSDTVNDRFEGRPPMSNFLQRVVDVSDKPVGLEYRVGAVLKQHSEQRRRTFINCWHQNDNDSYVMWSAYSSKDYGIAIQTSVARLRECLPLQVGIYKVSYLDHMNDSLPKHFPRIIDLLQKQKYFKEENEVRAIYLCDDEPSDLGFNVPVSLDTLAERIYVGPHATDWYVSTITDLVIMRGLQVPVIRSSI